MESNEFENDRLEQIASAIKDQQIPHDAITEILAESAFLDACTDSLRENKEATRDAMKDAMETEDAWGIALENLLGNALAADLSHYQQIMHGDGFTTILGLGGNLTINNVINLQGHYYTADVADTVTRALMDVAINEYFSHHIDEIDELLPLAEQGWATSGKAMQNMDDALEEDEDDLICRTVTDFFAEVYFHKNGTILELRRSLMQGN